MAKTSNPDALSLAELAPLLGVSKTRVHQLVDEGIIPKSRGGGFDPLQAALAVLGWYRRDEQTKQARLRLLHASAGNHERRLRRQLRHLVTVEELRELLAIVFEMGHEMVQTQTSIFHGEVAARLPDDQSRLAAFAIYDHLRRIMLGFRNGSEQLVRDIERDLLPADGRIAAVFGQIMAAAMVGEPHQESTPPTDGRRMNGKRTRRAAA